jgi:hypothetical protein
MRRSGVRSPSAPPNVSNACVKRERAPGRTRSQIATIDALLSAYGEGLTFRRPAARLCRPLISALLGPPGYPGRPSAAGSPRASGSSRPLGEQVAPAARAQPLKALAVCSPVEETEPMPHRNPMFAGGEAGDLEVHRRTLQAAVLGRARSLTDGSVELGRETALDRLKCLRIR